MERTKQRRATLLLPGVLLCISAVFLLLQPLLAAQGVREGLTLCTETVIPSLFPFLVLAAFFTRSGLCAAFGRAAAPLMRLFRLPGVAAGAVLMSLLGGFPVGLRMTADLLEAGQLSREQAKRMSLFCVNAGPAFLVGAVGGIMLGSRKAGWFLFACLSVAALLLGMIAGRLPQKDEGIQSTKSFHRLPAAKTARGIPGTVPQTETFPPAGEALVTAVADASGAMAAICAWIILFACFCNALANSGIPPRLQGLLQAFLEVSQGSRLLSAGANLPLLAAALGWCGLCVQCQLLPCLRRIGQKLPRFMCFRLLHALLAAGLCKAALLLFPQELPVFSNGVTAQPSLFSLSAPAAAAMLLMAALLILDIGKTGTQRRG